MPTIPIALAAASLGVAAVGTVASISAGNKANALAAQANVQNQHATDLQRQMNDLSAARQKRDSIRQARIASAQAQQTGESQGVANSSAAVGGQASIASQLGSNLSFLDQYNSMADQASVALGKAGEFEYRSKAAMVSASNANQISSLGMSVFANSPRISQVFGIK